jgi:hypothetical protein
VSFVSFVVKILFSLVAAMPRWALRDLRGEMSVSTLVAALPR